MQPLKSLFGVLGALVPVVYCGGLVYYFVFNVGGGSVDDVKDLGLGPTVLGLTIVGGLCSVALVVRLLRIFLAARAPGAAKRAEKIAAADEGAFDADAVFQRYMAKQSRDTEAKPAAPRPPAEGVPPARPTFGRRT